MRPVTCLASVAVLVVLAPACAAVPRPAPVPLPVDDVAVVPIAPLLDAVPDLAGLDARRAEPPTGDGYWMVRGVDAAGRARAVRLRDVIVGLAAAPVADALAPARDALIRALVRGQLERLDGAAAWIGDEVRWAPPAGVVPMVPPVAVAVRGFAPALPPTVTVDRASVDAWLAAHPDAPAGLAGSARALAIAARAQPPRPDERFGRARPLRGAWLVEWFAAPCEGGWRGLVIADDLVVATLPARAPAQLGCAPAPTVAAAHRCLPGEGG